MYVCLSLSNDNIWFAVPLVKVTNVQIDPESVTGTSATITWAHVDTSSSSMLGFFRGYRVKRFNRVYLLK